MEDIESREEETSGDRFAEDEDSGYLHTERARLQSLQQPLDETGIYLPRAIVKLHQPVHLKALALLRTGIGANVISQKLVRQLNLNPSPTTQTVCDPASGGLLMVHGALCLTLTMADTTREERTFDGVPFLAVDLYCEEMVLGTPFLCTAGLELSVPKRAICWSENTPYD